jgi:hypothetical protein
MCKKYKKKIIYNVLKITWSIFFYYYLIQMTLQSIHGHQKETPKNIKIKIYTNHSRFIFFKF